MILLYAGGDGVLFGGLNLPVELPWRSAAEVVTSASASASLEKSETAAEAAELSWSPYWLEVRVESGLLFSWGVSDIV